MVDRHRTAPTFIPTADVKNCVGMSVQKARTDGGGTWADGRGRTGVDRGGMRGVERGLIFCC